MDEERFIKLTKAHAKNWGINPLLLLSGIEGLYSFKDVPLNTINYEFLDSLILTIFSLRIGDQFHTLAEQNLHHNNPKISKAATEELMPLSDEQIQNSLNPFLQSFAAVLQGKTIIYQYHIKAIEAAALEIQTQQKKWNQKSIGVIVINICKEESSGYLTQLFRQG